MTPPSCADATVVDCSSVKVLRSSNLLVELKPGGFVLLGRRGRVGLIGLVIASVVVSLGTAPGAGAADSGLDSVLERLPAAPPVAQGYAFKDFAVPAVARKDARGCGKRERVLISSAVVAPRVAPGCRLVGGTWWVDQGAKVIRGAARVDVVPLVSEKSVWTQGGFGWTNAQRRAYMIWQQQGARECVVGGGRQCAFVLQSKGSGGRSASVTDVMSQTQWRTSCADAAGVVGTLASWGLAIPPAEKARFAALNCPRSSVVVRPLNKVNPLADVNVGNPFQAPSVRERAFDTESVLTAPAGPAISPELFGLHVPYPDQAAPNVAYSWLRLWDARTGWEPLEQNRGTYYWKTLDDAVAYAEARGLKVLYVFGDTPPWAGPSPEFPPTDVTEYSRFVAAVVGRYGKRIHAYEVWNEPNLHSPISASVADLVEMTQILHSAVDRIGGGPLVLTPSINMRLVTTVNSFFAGYLTKLGSIGWPVDGYAVHTYPRAEGGPADRAMAISKFKQLLTLVGAPKKAIWNTEINYGLGGLQEPRRVIDGADAEGYLAQTFVDSVRLGVEHANWYLWFPHPYDLLGIQLTPASRGTLSAWSWAHRQLVGASLTACATSGAAVVCGFERDGERYALAYSSTGESVRVSVPATLLRQCDMVGACQPIVGKNVLVGIRPSRLS